ncbi:hypothetical protein CF327_g2434 [Tilletia walkeri]|nr:hypothetical protein CF327_g2434 [Tilletia walkeri]
MPSTPPVLYNEPNPKRPKNSATMMWLSMAPETDPAALPIQDHTPQPQQRDHRQEQGKSQFVGVGAPDMLIPFNMRSRTASAGASSGGSPSLNLGRSIASLRMSSSSCASPPSAAGLPHQQQQAQEVEEEEDESDEEPCCTPDHALANDAMVLLASSTSSSSFRDTSVGLPPQSTYHYNNVGTAAVKLVKTPAATSSAHGRRSDYFSSIPGESSTNSTSTITSSTASSPPTFDFRNTFAPLAFNKGRGGGVASTAASKINGGGGIEFGGRQWSGKTAHAVELEMEALGDRAIMSFAPDATYLASRLEMLRKNLEAGGWERRPAWVQCLDEDGQELEQEQEQEQDETLKESEEVKVAEVAPVTEEGTKTPAEQDRLRSPKPPTPKPGPTSFKHKQPRSEFSLPPAPATSLIDAEYARAAHLPKVSNIEGATLSAAERSKIARASFLPAPTRMRENAKAVHVDEEEEEEEEEGEEEEVDREEEETSTPQLPPPLDPVVRAAALDARLEIRQLKRDDVVQVRELHCYHGDGNKSPGRETYTMSAGFLLRLLVDEKHVAVVAVKRPIPAPESPLPSDLANSIHSRFPSNVPSPSRMTPNLRVPSALSRQNNGRGNMYEVARSSSSLDAEADEDGEDGDGDEEEDVRSDAGEGSRSPSSFSSSADEVSPRTEFTRATSLSDRENEQASANTTIAAVETAAIRSAAPMPPRTEDQSALPAHGMTLPPHALPQSDSTFYERDADKPFLAGPLPVAPPLAVRVMAAPPPGHRLRSAAAAAAMLEGAENVVGVATAQLTTTEPLANELWPGLDADDTSARGAAVEQAHVLTLSVAPDERSQGLGARLLERLLEECRIRIGHNSLRRPESISISGRAKSMRAMVECHPSNERAIGLYKAAGFVRVEGPQGTRKNFYRGDDRIPLAYRLRVGGTDAHVYERRSELP